MRQEEFKKFAWKRIIRDGPRNTFEEVLRVSVIHLLGAALLVSAPSYSAELSDAPHIERLNRVFIGVPNQLTLPPGFSGLVDSSDAGCCEQTPHIDAANNVDSPKNHSGDDGGAETSVGLRSAVDQSLLPVMQTIREGDRSNPNGARIGRQR